MGLSKLASRASVVFLAILMAQAGGCALMDEIAAQSRPVPRRFELNSTDESLPVDQYITLGMPSISRGWTFSERTDALDVLVELVRTRAGALPHLDSAKSKDVFNKIVGTENMAGVSDRTAPIQARLMELNNAAFYELALLRVYTAAHLRTGMYDDEVALLLARSVWVEATHLDLSAASIRDGTPLLFADPAHETDRYRDSIKRSMLSLPKMLGKDVFFGTDARLRMVNGAMSSAKTLLAEFDPMTRTEFKVAMERVREQQTDSRLIAAYDRLIALNQSPGASQLDAALAVRPRLPRADGQWQRYASAPAGVSAEFPGRPLERIRQGGVMANEPSVVYTVWTQTDDGVRFTILRIRGMWRDRDRADYVRKFSKFLPRENVIKSRMLDKESMLTNETEFRFKHVGIARVIASGDDVTHVIIESTGNDIDGLRKKASKFFQSLKIEPFNLGLPDSDTKKQVTMAVHVAPQG